MEEAEIKKMKMEVDVKKMKMEAYETMDDTYTGVLGDRIKLIGSSKRSVIIGMDLLDIFMKVLCLLSETSL